MKEGGAKGLHGKEIRQAAVPQVGDGVWLTSLWGVKLMAQTFDFKKWHGTSAVGPQKPNPRPKHEKTKHTMLYWTSSHKKAQVSVWPVSLTCLMAVTVMTKKRGSPLVTGLVGVSMINCEDKRARSNLENTCWQPQTMGWPGNMTSPTPASTYLKHFAGALLALQPGQEGHRPVLVTIMLRETP